MPTPILVVVPVIASYVASLPVAATALMLAAPRILRSRISFAQALSVTLWQLIAFLAIAVVYFLATLEVVRPDPDTGFTQSQPLPWPLVVAFGALAVVPIVIIKFKLGTSVRNALRVSTAAGAIFGGMLLLATAIIFAVALAVRMITPVT